MSKKVNIKELGRQLKATNSEKTFKQLFDIVKPSVMVHFKKFNNPIEVIEDCYIEAMISVWNDIHKFDVEKYSISTMIFLKVQQNIIRYYKSVGGQFNNVDIDDPVVTNIAISDNEDELTYDLQEDFIKDENVEVLWSSIKTILDNDISYNILYDKYANNMKSKDIAEKYDTKLQNVLNRIFNAKKKIKNNDEVYYEYIK